MALSSKQVQKLGNCLREADPTPEDLELLDAFRREFDEPLLRLSHSICHAIRATDLPFLVAGRTKRTKSIIRKLRRPQNRNMDLSRMDDVVGVRILVRNAAAQQRVIEEIAGSQAQVREPYDYRTQPAGRYRAVHMILGEPSRRVEVQVRTCAQHLWADACERCGEPAKEGNPNDEDRAYLAEVGTFAIAVDEGAAEIGTGPIQASMRFLHQRFIEETSLLGSDAAKSYVVVYNNLTNQLIRCELFEPTPGGREEAIGFYRYQTHMLNDSEFDVLVLNSSSAGTLRVTHPRYFPE